jgi:uncharacterized protein (TIGR02145 family)
MQNKIGFLKGLDRDSSFSKRDPNSYYDALNIRVLTDDGLSTGSITNEKGNSLLFSMPESLGAVFILPEVVTSGTYRIFYTYSGFVEFTLLPDTISNTYNTIISNVDVISNIANGYYSVLLNNNVIYFIGLSNLVNVTATSPSPIINTMLESNGFKILGVGTMRDWVVVFTTATVGTTGNGQIWKCKYDKITQEITNSTFVGGLIPEYHLVYNGILNFNMDYRVGEVVSRYQDASHGKIFFIDGLNTMKHINILDPLSLALTSSEIDIVPNVTFSQPKITEVLTGGSLKSGSIQYSYQLFNQGGAETSFAPASGIIHLTDKNEYSSNTLTYKGVAPDTITGKAVKVNISDIDTTFDYIRLISIYYTSQEGQPEINIIEEKPIPSSSSINFIDDGNPIGVYALTEYNSTGSRVFIPGTITTKNNYLVAANIKEQYFDIDESTYWDARAYRWRNDTGVFMIDNVEYNTPYFISETADCVLTRAEQEIYKYTPSSSHLGGYGINISYEFKLAQVKIDDDSDNTKTLTNIDLASQLWSSKLDSTYIDNNSYTNYASPINREQLIGFTRDEIYRFGIVFFDNKGRQSFTKWIGDIKMPSIRDLDTKVTYNTDAIGGIESGSGVDMHDYNTVFEDALGTGIYANVLGVNFTVSNVPTGLSYRIVRVRREQQDKYILGQGLMGCSRILDATNVGTYNHVTSADSGGTAKGDTGTLYNGVSDKYLISFKSPEVLFTNVINPVQGDLVEIVALTDNTTYASDPNGWSGEAATYKIVFTPKIKSLTPHVKETSVIKDGIKVVDTLPVNPDYRYVIENGGTRTRVLNHNNAYKGSALMLGLVDTLTVASVDNHIILNYTKDPSLIQYGGNSYYDRINNTYIACGNLNSGIVYGGDAFIGMFEYLNAMLYNQASEDVKECMEVVYIPLESSVNVEVGHGTYYSKDNADWKLCESVAFGLSINSAYPANYTDMYQYNSAYSVEPIGKTYTVKPLFFQNNKINDYRVIVSEKHVNNQIVDSWTKFLYNNLIEVNSAYGSINKIITYRNRLFFFQDNAFGVLGFEDRQLLKDNTGLPLTLGTGGILTNFQYISEKTGTKSKFGVVDTGKSLYFVDLNNRKFMRFNGDTDETISDDGLSSFFRTFDYGNTLIQDSTNNYKGIHGVFDPINKRVLYTMFGNEFIIGTEEVSSIVVKYGALYNWYAATDVRVISSGGGWGVPEWTDFTELRNYIDPTGTNNSNIVGLKLKDTDNVFWDVVTGSPVNAYLFNARGCGNRDSAGTFSGIKEIYFLWTITPLFQYEFDSRVTHMTSYSDIFNVGTELGPSSHILATGDSIRLFRPATLTELSQDDGTPCANYTGNDGKIYRTVKIGTQVWLADNLCETKYADGSTIPLVTDNTEWSALTTGGMCYYDNDINNSYINTTSIVNTTSNGKTFSYNEVLGGFESFYSFVPTIYENTDFGVISVNPTTKASCYLHTKGNRGVWYDVAYNSHITSVIAPTPDIKKVFTNLEFNSYVEINGVDVPLSTINTIQSWNSYQNTGSITLTNPTNIRRRFRTWRYQFPRVSSLRLMDYSLSTKLSFVNSVSEDRYFRLDDIIVDYLVPMI